VAPGQAEGTINLRRDLSDHIIRRLTDRRVSTRVDVPTNATTKGHSMRNSLLVALPLLVICAAAQAQTTRNDAPPAQIGNRANGHEYQPTPDVVAPREQAAGVAPSASHDQQNNQTLTNLDRNLMKSEGLNPDNTPPNLAGGVARSR